MTKFHKYDPSTIQYLAQLNPKPSGKWIGAVDRLVRQLKVDGNWQLLDRFWIFATEQQQNARVSLVNPTASTITEVNNPTWTKDVGYASNGTSSYLNSNYNPSSATTQGVNFTLNNNSYGFYVKSQPSYANMWGLGSYDGHNISALAVLFFQNPNYLWSMYNNSTTSTITKDTGIVSPFLSLFAGGRITSTTGLLYNRGIQVANAQNNPTSAIPNLSMYILGYNTSGSITTPTTSTISLAFFGSGNINQLKLYNAINSFANTIGFQV